MNSAETDPEEPQRKRFGWRNFIDSWGTAIGGNAGVIIPLDSLPGEGLSIMDWNANEHHLVLDADEVPSTQIDRRISIPFTEDDPWWQTQRNIDWHVAALSGELALHDCLIAVLEAERSL